MPPTDNYNSSSDQENNIPHPRSASLISGSSSANRKVICRYGPGCTHILDPSHREKFWHPSTPIRENKGDSPHLRFQFICNECGYGTNSIEDLQLHLKRKTAWSNQSLVGCRISCLVDYKEWHEGYVTQLHKSGKHYVEFRMVNERRWLYMKKIAFYIVERPSYANFNGVGVPRNQSSNSVEIGRSSSEFKSEVAMENDGLAPIESNWVYCENISIDYAFAQAVLFKLYGNTIQETGHLTKGHICLTENDRRNALAAKGSLLYGELLPRGVNKALGPSRMDAANASVIFDLGMGTGKILMQSFLQFKNLRYMYGIELSSGRYKIAEEALMRLIQLLGPENFNVQINPGKFIVVREIVSNSDESEESSERVIHFECGNMFSIKNIEIADIVMMETDFPSELNGDLFKLLTCMQDGARVLSYLDLRKTSNGITSIRDTESFQFSHHFQQLDNNRHLSDRYPTSWSVQRGHHFFLWTKINPASDPSANKQSGSGSWGQSLSLGLGIGSSSRESSNPSILVGSDPNGNIPRNRNTNQSCLPFGMGELFRFLFGRQRKNIKNNNENQNFGPSAGLARQAHPPMNLSSTSDRTVIPINLDGSRDDRKISVNIKKQQSNYPNYIERVLSNQSNFLDSTNEDSGVSRSISPRPSPREKNEERVIKHSARSVNSSSNRSDSESEASPRSENGNRRKSRKNSSRRKNSHEANNKPNNEENNSNLNINEHVLELQKYETIKGSYSEDFVHQTDNYSPVKSDSSDNHVPLTFMSSSYASDDSPTKRDRNYVNEIITSPKDGNFCTPTTQLILASYNDQHPITFNNYESASDDEDITSLPFSTRELASIKKNNIENVARKLEYSDGTVETNISQPTNINLLREADAVSL